MKRSFYLLLILYLISGCDKLLDIEPATDLDSNEITTLDDVDYIMNGVYRNFIGLYVYQINGMQVIRSDQVRYTGTSEPSSDYRRSVQEDPRAGIWASYYQTITGANFAIKYLNKIGSSTEMNKYNRIMGEALFMRAICHFELLRMYSVQYDPSTKDRWGIILYTEAPEKINDINGLSSVEECYYQITTDLKKSAELLSGLGQRTEIWNYGRADIYWAYSQLAKVYFQKNDYDSTIWAVNQVLNSSTRFALEPDLSRVFLYSSPNAEPSKEIIMQFTMTDPKVDGSWSNDFPFIITTNSGLPYYLPSQSYIRDANFDKTNDQRSFIWYDLTSNSNPVCKKFVSASTDRLMNFIVTRVPELLLARAEASILSASSDFISARRDLNLVKSRAIINYIDLTMDANLLDSIRLERIRELQYEPNRYYDILRMKIQVPVGDRSSSSYKPFDWNSIDAYYRYPEREIVNNEIMKQQLDSTYFLPSK
jgi:hypothetical protein